MGAGPLCCGMCICVDCHWVDRCQAYHTVERQHGAPHLSSSPEPVIHVQVRPLPRGQVGTEWDVRACSDFRSDPGRWGRLRPGAPLPT
jgi:hypothetical protein